MLRRLYKMSVVVYRDDVFQLLNIHDKVPARQYSTGFGFREKFCYNLNLCKYTNYQFCLYSGDDFIYVYLILKITENYCQVL